MLAFVIVVGKNSDFETMQSIESRALRRIVVKQYFEMGENTYNIR